MLVEEPVKLTLKPIGVVRTEASDEEGVRGEGEFESTVEVYPEFEEALDGVEDFSHLFIISYFSRLKPDQQGVLKVRPRRLLRKGFRIEELPLMGVFALDSPTRPNPIGLSLARLVKREGRRLTVSGLDCFHGTPVLDIKPYQPDYRAEEYTLPTWYARLLEKAGHV